MVKHTLFIWIIQSLLIYSAFAKVDIRAQARSLLMDYPSSGLVQLIIAVQAKSIDTSGHSISALQASLQLNQVLKNELQSLSFDYRYLNQTEYQVTEDYRPDNGRIRFIYTHKQGAPLDIPAEWTTLNRIEIVFNQTQAKPVLSWHTEKPEYFICDDYFQNITGVKHPIYDFFASATITFEFPIEGWYLVSVPGLCDDMDVEHLFPTALSGVAFEWVENKYVIQKELEPGKGYWIVIPEPTTVSVSVMPLYNYSGHFDQRGWHLIGSINDTVSFYGSIAQPPENIIPPAFYYKTSIRDYEETNILTPQKAYWVAVLGPCDYSLQQNMPTLAKTTAFKGQAKNFYTEFGSKPPPPPQTLSSTQNKKVNNTRIKLYQNYPNPFNSATHFSFHVPKEYRVKITIYNLNGQTVCTVVDKIFKAGYHTIPWNGLDDHRVRVGTGIYYYKMETKDFNEIKKLIYIR